MSSDKFVRFFDLIAAAFLGSGLTFLGLAFFKPPLFASWLGFAIIGVSIVAVMFGRGYFKSKP